MLYKIVFDLEGVNKNREVWKKKKVLFTSVGFEGKKTGLLIFCLVYVFNSMKFNSMYVFVHSKLENIFLNDIKLLSIYLHDLSFENVFLGNTIIWVKCYLIYILGNFFLFKIHFYVKQK